MMSESDKIAGYEPPSVTDLGKLEDITRTATGSGYQRALGHQDLIGAFAARVHFSRS